jgi:hypothetical protein
MLEPKKIIAFSLLIFFVLSFLIYPIKDARASAIFGDPWQFIKQFVIYPLVRAIGNALESRLLNKLNQQITGINNATPAFITNWRNHIFDSQARGNDVFRAVLADTQVCDYMSDTIKTSFGADKFAGAIAGATVKDASGKVVYENKTNVPGTASFQELGKCTLPTGFSVPDFNKDFRKGGWQAWDRMLEPQNNLLGIYSLAMNEQQRQTEVEQQAAINSAVAGNGFLASKLTKALPGGTDTGFSNTSPTGCVDVVGGTLTGGSTGPAITTRCTFFGKDVTPGFLKAGGAGTGFDAKLKVPGAAKEITDVVLGLFAAVLQGTMNKLSNYLGQVTYNALSGSDRGYDETQKKPTGEDTQINQAQAQVDATSAKLNQKEANTAEAASGDCSSSCMSGKQASCTTENQTTTCNTTTDPATGNPDNTCQNDIDQPAYDACMVQAQNECDAQCPTIPVNTYGHEQIP